MAKEHLIHKQFPLPKKCWRDCKTVIMRELDGDDDIQIAVWLDQQEAQSEGKGTAAVVGAMKREQRESVRCSLVMVDGKRVNENGIAFAPFDKWKQTTKVALSAFFNELNGLDGDELGKSMKEAQAVDPTTLQPIGLPIADKSPGG